MQEINLIKPDVIITLGKKASSITWQNRPRLMNKLEGLVAGNGWTVLSMVHLSQRAAKHGKQFKENNKVFNVGKNYRETHFKMVTVLLETHRKAHTPQ